MFKWFNNIGPGTLVAAAFIGPGTVTVCTIAGVTYGFSLLWAMTLSIVATIVLQEMAARVGIITQKGLADVINNQIPNKSLRYIVLGLILSAIVVGNAAYEAGNITGAALGMEAVFNYSGQTLFSIIIGSVAFVLLYIGNYKFLEKSLVILVLIMSSSFLITAILTRPNLFDLFKNMFIPTVPENSIFTIIGLVGTTVVPYNLFLHASLVKEKWKNESDLVAVKKDTIISIVLGGLVSMSIIVSATSIQTDEVHSALDLAKGLEPLFGVYAKYFLGLGLFSAGITSCVTAPLAAAYVANSCFRWKADMKDIRFRMTWLLILLSGVLFSCLKIKPILIIQFAQIANGMLLPIVAIFLLWVVNKSSVLGKYKNTIFQNIIASVIILVALGLGVKSIVKVLGFFETVF